VNSFDFDFEPRKSQNMHNNHSNDEHSEVNERTSLLPNDSINNDARELNEQRASSGISWYFAVFLIVNAALGAGLLNFSKAFDNAGGILISTIIQTVYFQLNQLFFFYSTINGILTLKTKGVSRCDIGSAYNTSLLHRQQAISKFSRR
jgi:hypothetical protein